MSTTANRQLSKQLDALSKQLDATRPFYAAVGAGDLAVAFARSTAADVQTRFSKVDLEPKVLREQAMTEAKALPARFESLVADYLGEFNDGYTDLAERGKSLVARIRGQQATADLKAEADKTTAKAKTTGTQAKKTTRTTKSSAKATGTSARKTAGAAKKATADAAAKTGR